MAGDLAERACSANFAVVYATTQLGLPKSTMLNAIIIGSLIEVFTIPLFGYISDIVGRRPLYFAGAIFTILFAFPLFWLFDTKNALVIGATVAVAISFGHGLMFGLLSTYRAFRHKGALYRRLARLPGRRGDRRWSLSGPSTSLTQSFGGTTGVSVLLIVLASILHRNALRPRDARHAALTSYLSRGPHPSGASSGRRGEPSRRYFDCCDQAFGYRWPIASGAHPCTFAEHESGCHHHGGRLGAGE